MKPKTMLFTKIKIYGPVLTAVLGIAMLSFLAGPVVADDWGGIGTGGVGTETTISSVTASSGYQGDQNLIIAIVGSGTNFVNGVSVADFGTDITVNSTTVTDATHCTANITIKTAAVTGARNVTVTTGAETATGTNIFTVNAPSLSTVVPSSGAQGWTGNITVTGIGTHFINGTTTSVFSGTGITVNSTTVTGVTTATVNITIAGGAALGARDLTMTTNLGVPVGTEIVTMISAFTVTASGPLSSVVIDDYEGLCVSSYYTAGTLTSNEITTVDKHEGSNSERVEYTNCVLGYGLVGGIETSNRDLTATNAVSLWVKGDGSNNTVRLDLKEVGATGETYSGTDISLSNTSWHEVQIPFSQFTRNPYGYIGDGIFSKIIEQYQLVYTGTNISSSWNYVDYIIATVEATPVVVSNLSITREADTVGSGVIVSWQVAPVSSPVDVWTKTGTFETLTTSWVKEQSNYVPTSWTNATQVGTGTQKYYKVMPAGATLTSADLTQEVVGKFDITLNGGAVLKKELISSPLILTSSNIDNAIGKQLTPGVVMGLADKVYKFNGTGWDPAWLRSSDSTWRDSSNAPSTMTIDPDAGYWVYICANHPTKEVTLVGAIASSSRSISVSSTQTLIGTCYPIPVTLGNSGLESSGATPGIVMGLATRVYRYDSTTDSFEPAWLKTGAPNTWMTPPPGPPSTMQLTPGQGYWIYEPSSSSGFTWTYPKPY